MDTIPYITGRIVAESVQFRLDGGRHCARCGESGEGKELVFEGISTSDCWAKMIQSSRKETRRFHQVLDKSEISIVEERVAVDRGLLVYLKLLE